MNYPPTTVAQTTRRSYLAWLLGLASTAASAVAAIPLVRFTLSPLKAAPAETEWSDAGPVCDVKDLTSPLSRTVTLEQIDGWRKTVSEKVVYISKDPAGNLCALSAVCPHLGCCVQWQESKNSFVCPCHGACYEPNGTRTGGPAPRGMDTLETKVQDGRLFVHYQRFRQLAPTKEVIS